MKNYAYMDTARALEAYSAFEGPMLVVAHLRPDGDAVGSVAATVRALNLCDIEAIGYIPDVPDYLRSFLGDEIVEELPDIYNSVVMVDVTEQDRTPLKPEHFEGRYTINIDHHRDNSCEADHRFVDPSASSACEMIWIVAKTLGDLTGHEVSNDHRLALACYLGIRTDTGSFAFNTSENTFLVTSEIAASGADMNALVQELSKTTKRDIDLLALGLANFKWHHNGLAASVIITRENRETMGLDDQIAVQHALSMLRSCDDARVALSLVELDDGSWKGSMRANKPLVVNEVASLYDGGGHAQAAGFKLPAGADPHAAVDDIFNRLHLK